MIEVDERTCFSIFVRSMIVPAALILFALAWTPACRNTKSEGFSGGGFLGDLAKPQEGRSMRATSAMRVGELRRGPDGDRNAGPSAWSIITTPARSASALRSMTFPPGSRRIPDT